ncbi:HlyD family secretion protein [Pseudoblastomonas halimionae]|uniref:HlyD family efflux transporter periplasmic adaptor subunit n=1 Tax=Alteriqipengyuania halimionae TaxID=1926630 RepID=A0A6I4U421_9SPHN|nr:HlyD family secretion protein [Alteriqipengyuania halimionae]MXP10476.1 HlyD family efflux transporter periplasmic adaptor subunit [Alteriqipengyuania halimionae]
MTNPTTQTDAEVEAIEEQEAPPAADHGKGWSPNLSRRRIGVGFFILLAGVLAALFAWGLPPFDGGDQTTNNAYVRGRTTVVSPQVAGYLVEVPVTDFQRVKKGDLLARIDDAPYREKVQQGAANTAAQRASLANSAQSLRSARAQLELQDAAVASAQAGLQKAQADMKRIAELVDEGSVSLRERDQARAALQQAQAGVRQAKAQRAIADENVRSVNVGRGALEAQVSGAEASRGLAEFELSRTEIRAPRSGRLSEVTARVGQLVSAGTQLMYIVPDELWVVANFKETQTAKMAVGQRATLSIDALGGIELTGRVQSIAPAASSEFSLVKPDTGAGNFVKVPQRIAVRIVLDEGQAAAKRLGPGMSVVATVHTKE